MGIDLDIFELISWSTLDFSISRTLRLKGREEEFRAVTVYGPSYEDKKEAFLSELHSLFVDNPIPTLIGGGILT